jgi:hypothetical protein
VIGVDLKWLGKPFKEVTPVLKGADDGEHFAVPDLVVSLSWVHRLGSVGDGMPVSVILLL